MASSNDKKKPTPGVRGPGGPPPAPLPGQKSGQKSGSPAGQRPDAASRMGARPPKAMPTQPASPLRRRFEEFSLPIVAWLQRLPKFVVIITPGLLLFLGLIQTGSLKWLGGVLLLLVAVLLGWLTALSWPVISGRSKVIRVVIILVVIGFAWMKFFGKF